MENNSESSKKLVSLMRYLSLAFKGFSVSVMSNDFSISQDGEITKQEHSQYFSNCEKLDLREISMVIQSTRMALSEIIEFSNEKFGEDEVDKQIKLSSETMKLFTENRLKEDD